MISMASAYRPVSGDGARADAAGPTAGLRTPMPTQSRRPGSGLANVGGRKHPEGAPMFVKVCGLSTPDAVRVAAEAGADAVGFVLTRSPREVTPEQVRNLLTHVPSGLPAVAVFRHEPAADAVAVAREAGLAWVQLHGDRSPADVRTVHDAGMKLIRAVTTA